MCVLDHDVHGCAVSMLCTSCQQPNTMQTNLLTMMPSSPARVAYLGVLGEGQYLEYSKVLAY